VPSDASVPESDGEAAPVADPDDVLNAALTRVLRWASREAVVRELAGPAAAGLSPTDLWLLDGVVRSGPVRVGDIAAWQGVDKSTVTSQLRRITDRGLVVRTVDPSDRRAVLVTASERGLRLHRTVNRQGSAVLTRLLADWEPADRQDFARLLSRFADELGTGPVRR
jgi:DNA-binding MarR family transcriptional regulator